MINNHDVPLFNTTISEGSRRVAYRWSCLKCFQFLDKQPKLSLSSGHIWLSLIFIVVDTGKLLGRPSREFSNWCWPDTTTDLEITLERKIHIITRSFRLEETSGLHLVQPTQLKPNYLEWAASTMCSHVLNISTDVDSTTPEGKPFLCCMIITEKRVFLCSKAVVVLQFSLTNEIIPVLLHRH